MWRLAAMSPRSMRLASSISSVGGEQVDAADRAQVEAQRVEARLDSQVELGLLRLPRLVALLRLLVGGEAVLGDDVDAVLDQVGVEVLHLLLGDLDLLERPGDLLEGQVAALAALGDERPKLVRVLEGKVAVQLRSCPRAGVLFAPAVCSRLPGYERVSLFGHSPPPPLLTVRGPGGGKYMGWPCSGARDFVPLPLAVWPAAKPPQGILQMTETTGFQLATYRRRGRAPR